MNKSEIKTAGPKKNSNVKKRVLTAVVYVLIWTALFALKWMVPDNWGAIGFDVLFTAISVLSCNEFLKAVSNPESGQCTISSPQRTFTMAFCALVVPLHAILQITMQEGLLAVACAFTIYVMFLAAASVFDHQKSTVKGTIYCVFCMLYCGVLSSILSSINHLETNSMAALLVLFGATVLTDTGAFGIGTALKKVLPMKLAPQLSPNKTVIGAIGGIIGGIVGALLAYCIIYFLGGFNGQSPYLGSNFSVYLTFSSEKIHPIVSFALVGLATSVMAQIGDLFESAIKRESKVKDMGRLLPGHGGVLDRFDSMLYCSVVVLLCFGTVIF